MTTLAVLSWGGRWGEALRAAVSNPFERETGVRVHHVQHVGLALPQRLAESLARGERPPVDVVWSNAVPALRAARAGWCEELQLSVLDPLELRDRAWPSSKADARFVVHPYVVYYVLVHQKEVPADSWDVLFDDRHRGRIALYPGGNGLMPIAQRLGGGRLEDIPHDMDACFAWLARLKPQIRELEYSIGMEERFMKRELDLAFRALPNALGFRATGVPVGFTVPREGTTDTVDALFIPRGVVGDTRRIAQRFIEFALRSDVQEAWCELLGAMPVHRNALPPGVLRARSDLPLHADDHRGILHIAEGIKVEHEADWERRFREIFAQGLSHD